jgi:hypothetical protein
MEKLTVISPRVAARHRAIIKKASRKLKVSDAEVVRRGVVQFGLHGVLQVGVRGKFKTKGKDGGRT